METMRFKEKFFFEADLFTAEDMANSYEQFHKRQGQHWSLDNICFFIALENYCEVYWSQWYDITGFSIEAMISGSSN